MNTILVVDDAPNIREFCRMELEQEGYRVRLAADGHEALAQLQLRVPDCVVLDVGLRRMGGLEVARRIRMTSPTLPLIFHTAHHADLVRDYCQEEAISCVEKREDLSGLKTAIAVALGSAKDVGHAAAGDAPYLST